MGTSAGPSRKAAIQGHFEAQFRLGDVYENGHLRVPGPLGPVTANALAVGWYEKSAANGFAEAQCRLGVCYRDGQLGRTL
jgi:hypothetical protein